MTFIAGNGVKWTVICTFVAGAGLEVAGSGFQLKVPPQVPVAGKSRNVKDAGRGEFLKSPVWKSQVAVFKSRCRRRCRSPVRHENVKGAGIGELLKSPVWKSQVAVLREKVPVAGRSSIMPQVPLSANI